MALQVWLPLDGELRNKGLNNGTTITENGGAPVYENGKTGLSLVCNGSKNWRISGVTLGTNVTIAWWSKTTVNGKMSWVLESDASAILNFFESNIYTLNVGDSNNNPFKTSANANINVLHDGKWHHFAVVFDANSVLLYIDGEYKGKATTYRSPASTNKILKLAGDFQRAHRYDWNGSLSDFRVYDDTLTAQDVRELYFGKILEVTPQWRDADRIHDASGFNFPLTPYNITVAGNEAKFNGSSSYIQFNGLNLKSGGTVSIWANLPAKPNVQRIYYCDPSSKMIVGYLAGGTILTAANNVSKPSYQSTGITWKNMHHIVAVYGNDRQPSALYVNGVQPATGTSSVWTNSGEIASIGRRIGSGGADYLSGSVNEVKVFSTQLTASEAKKLYENGPCTNSWTPSEPVWMRVLHHNNPKAARFESETDGKDKDTEDQFSKLKIFFNNDNYRRSDGTYEFMVKERLESGSTEQVFRWKQTSNPTASTVTGYQLISQTMNPNRTFGLKRTGSYAVFHNGSTWWCACGAFTAFNNGIPGFGGTVLTGYIDLYVRVDK